MLLVLPFVASDFVKMCSKFNETIDVPASCIVMQAVDTAYSQVNFDDSAQNVAYFRKLAGSNAERVALVDVILLKVAGDTQRMQQVCTIFRDAASKIHVALASFNTENRMADVAKPIDAMLEKALSKTSS